MADPSIILNPAEKNQLEVCEAVIKRGLNTFIEVGNALMVIRDERLYREAYSTFEDYCNARWGIKRNYANKVIAATITVNNLSTTVPKSHLPENEAQVRPITQLPPQLQQEAWQQAVELAPTGKLTASHVQQAVEGVKQANGMSQELSVLLSHESTEWYTPSEYIKAVKAVMGGIDLDPASAETAQEIVRADHYFTIQEDGLAQDWHGRVFLNPPYSTICGRSNQELWSQKLIQEYETGQVREAILLVKSALGYIWFEKLWDVYPVCFARELISFIRPDGIAGGKAKLGSAFFYFGNNMAGFKAVFSQYGRIIEPEKQAGVP